MQHYIINISTGMMMSIIVIVILKMKKCNIIVIGINMSQYLMPILIGQIFIIGITINQTGGVGGKHANYVDSRIALFVGVSYIGQPGSPGALDISGSDE